MEELQQQLHNLRKEIDQSTTNVSALKDLMTAQVCIREVAIAVTKLQEAKMWLGKALEETGSKLPEQFADKAGTTPVAPATGSATPAATPVVPTAPTQPAQNLAPANPGAQAPQV